MIFDFLKGSKSINLERVCEKSRTPTEIKKVFDRTYREVYLITHPFYSSHYRFLPENELEQSFDSLSKSVKKASKRDKILAILTLENDSKCMLDENTYKYLCKIQKVMEKNFKSSLYTRIQTGWFYEEKWHKLPIQFDLPLESVQITARWVYWERCVLSTLEWFSDVHNIPENNCFLDIDESVIAKRKKDYKYDTDLILCPEWETWLISLDEIFRRKKEWQDNYLLNKDSI